jgi:filamentous hemagglutinin family protein
VINKTFLHWCLKTASSWSLFGIIAFVPTLVFAESNISPDNTLGAENSRVVPNYNGQPIEVITGGATRGINLFHSFREFNVSEGRGAYFMSPGADIQNILARVTGMNRSEILGRLGTFGESKANLFLMNPNGIIFGKNASLDVQGSFVGTTANAIQFGERGNFSATNPEVPTLLTVNPSALFFNQITRSEIINRSPQIAIPGSYYLIGGDITFDGGIATSVGNRLELGTVAGTGTVGLIGSGNQMQLVFPEGLSRGDIVLKNNAAVTTAGGGAITVNTGNLSLSGNSSIISTLQAGEGTPGVAAGDVVVNATGNVILDNFSYISSRGLENSLGDTGNIVINAGSISLKNQSLIDSTGPKSRGNISLNVKDNLSLDQGFIVSSGLYMPKGKSGDITITSRNINLNNQSFISSANNGQGQGGKITLNVREAIILTESQISTTSAAFLLGQVNNQPSGDIEINTKSLTLNGNGLINSRNLDQGKGGDIRIVADDSILLKNGVNASISSQSLGPGNSGNIELKTRSLALVNGGNITTSSFGSGNGGDLLVNASDSVNLSGITTFIDPETGDRFVMGGGLTASAFGAGNGGQVILNTQRLSINDGGYITTTNNQSGRGGNLTINAKDSIEIAGRSPTPDAPSRVSTSTLGSANAGDMQVSTPLLLVRNGAEMLANARGTGNAGVMTIDADRIRLSNNASINANTRSPNKDPNSEQATINIRTQDLSLRRNSNITTNATGENVVGGNINIDTDKLIALENSRISANSDNFRGGRVKIDAQAVFVGTQPSDVSQFITATSGVGLSGTVDVNSPDNSSIQNNLTELPTNAIDTNALIANSCIARANKKQENSFTITGAGALPNRPGDVSMSNYSTDKVHGVTAENTSRSWKKGDRIIEPTDVYRLPDGQLVMSRECE